MSHSGNKDAPAGRIAEDWQVLLDQEFAKPYMSELRQYLAERKSQRAVIYPHSSLWFNAFALTALADVSVVILGQDPYHGPGQAHGLSFSVPSGVRPPPSLRNIFKELDDDSDAHELSAEQAESLQQRGQGCLEGWSHQGVFLLNSVLTVERGEAASHQGRGWEMFTDQIIRHLNDAHQHLVFLLWGSYAQKKGQVIDARRHLVLRAPHPSPLSAHRGFLGCRHFSRTNDYLQKHGKSRIDWRAVS